MNYAKEIINRLIAELDTADTELLILIVYLMRFISKDKYTDLLNDLYVICTTELIKREVDIEHI